MASFQQLSWLEAELEELNAQHLLRKPEQRHQVESGQTRINDQTYLDFSTNDYLGLSQHPEVINAACQAAQLYGAGARASQLVSGFTPIHAELTRAISDFEQTEATLLFPSGYAANLGTITALAHSQDLVISERHNHACLIDGCRLSGAKLRLFRQDELLKLKALLDRETGYRRRFLVTDTVLSMEGTIAPLCELCDLAERYEVTMIVDEAHATGVLGSNGRGAVSYLKLQDRIPVRIGTLSKALGSQGGFVTGSKHLIDYLWNHARTQMFSTALSPMACGAALAALKLIQADSSPRETIHQHVSHFKQMLESAGIGTINHPLVPIIPCFIQSPEKTLVAAEHLKKAGFIVAAIRPPTVPHNTSRLRVSLSAIHQTDDITKLAVTLQEILKTLSSNAT